MDQALPEEIPEEWKYHLPIRPCHIEYNLPSYKNIYHHVPAQNQAKPGVLDLLPLELLQDMLAKLDLLSLTNLQAVNRQAFTVVNSIPAFKAIITHARTALRSIIAVKAGHLVTCQDLYDSMLFPKCATCGDYGEYIYVLTCKRVCYLCLSYWDDYLPRRAQSVIREFGLDRTILETLPCLESIPGTYAFPPSDQRQRLILYDSSAARSAGVTLHGSEEAMSQHVQDAKRREKAEYQRKLHRFFSKDATRYNGGIDMHRKPQRPFEDSHDHHERNPLRWMGIVQVPSLQPVSREVKWGFHCAGCQGCQNLFTHWTKVYTPSTFRDHIKRLGPLINLASDEHPKLYHTGMQRKNKTIIGIDLRL